MTGQLIHCTKNVHIFNLKNTMEGQLPRHINKHAAMHFESTNDEHIIASKSNSISNTEHIRCLLFFLHNKTITSARSFEARKKRFSYFSSQISLVRGSSNNENNIQLECHTCIHSKKKNQPQNIRKRKII